jgi:hypothetical protein
VFPRFKLSSVALGVLLAATLAWTADYTGPRPPKPDLVYLMHADNLIPAEAAEAKQEKNDTYTVAGATSPARTPLAEPIFLMQSDKITPESLELYRLDVKSGHREITLSGGRRRGGPRALHLSVTKVERGLYRIEAAETLENGEYALTPSGSNKVFCFEVF